MTNLMTFWFVLGHRGKPYSIRSKVGLVSVGVMDMFTQVLSLMYVAGAV